MFALFRESRARTRPQDLWPFLISETGLEFLIWTQGEIGLGKRASPVNWAHVKRPWIALAKLNWCGMAKTVNDLCQPSMLTTTFAA